MIHIIRDEYGLIIKTIQALNRNFSFKMNSPFARTAQPVIINLTSQQLNHIFEQLGLSQIQTIPYSQVKIQLEPFQIQNLGSNPIAVPMYPNIHSQTVESIISTTTPMITTRINKKFMIDLANLLQINEKQLMEAIQSESDISKLTSKLNDIFGGLIDNPLTEQEVRQLVALTF